MWLTGARKAELTTSPYPTKSGFMLSSIEFHKEFSPLIVSTNEVGVDGLKLKHIISQQALDALLFEPSDAEFCWKSNSQAEIYCELERENDHSFKVSFQGELNLYTLCGRCLNQLNVPCKLDFGIRMIEKKHLFENEAECSFDTADLVSNEPLVGYFSDRCIDLGVILRDQIFLQMPDYPQCVSDGSFLSCNKSLAQANENNQHNDNPFVKLFKK